MALSPIGRIKVNVTGARGLSDYQLWVQAGNSGTYQDYLNYLAHIVIANNPGFKGDQGNPGGNVMSTGPFSSLAGQTIPTGVDLIRTSGQGSAWYIAFAGTDALVTAYPLAVTKTANGRYFRLDPRNTRLEAFGADPTGVVSSSPAVLAMCKYLSEPTFYPPWSPYAGGRGAWYIDCGPGTFMIDAAHSLKGFAAHWRGGGVSTGGYAAGAATRFKMTATGSFTLDQGNTGDTYSTQGGDGSIFEGIVFEGSRAGQAPFTANATFTFLNSSCIGSGASGLHILGNSNSFQIIGGDFSYNIGSAFLAEGANANAGRAVGYSAVDNGRYGVEDLSFLGNHWTPNNSRNNALGHIFMDNANSSGSTSFGYEEGGSPPSQIAQNCLAIGGTRGSGYTYNSPFIYGRFGCVGANGVILERKSVSDSSKLLTVNIATSFDAGQIFAASKTDVVGDRNMRYVGNDIVWGNGQGAGDIDHVILGVQTTNTLGRASIAPYGVNIFRRGFSLGSRIWTEGTALPTATDAGAGETVWNIAPALGDPQSWVYASGGWKPSGIVGAMRATGLSSSSTAAQIVAALQAAGLAA